jgi:hypothetical protein
MLKKQHDNTITKEQDQGGLKENVTVKWKLEIIIK